MNPFDVKSFEQFQNFGTTGMDASMKALSAVSKSAQAIAVESADYSKRAFEDGTAAVEKLFSAKSLENAMEIQQNYFKQAYEGFVAQTTKMTELYSEFAKEAARPYQADVAK